jgi:hypothetical protein
MEIGVFGNGSGGVPKVSVTVQPGDAPTSLAPAKLESNAAGVAVELRGFEPVRAVRRPGNRRPTSHFEVLDSPASANRGFAIGGRSEDVAQE